MNRRSAETTDSLELLLDAICNTFGAVIFISMLVAILVSQSTPQASDQENSSPLSTIAEARQRIQEVEEKIRQLEQIRDQQKEMTDRFSSEESRQLSQRVRTLTDERVKLLSQKTELLDAQAEISTKTVRMQVALNNQQNDLRAALEENRVLARKLEVVSSQQGRTARVPKLRTTRKLPFVYAVDDGKLFQFTNSMLQVNAADCIKDDTSGSIKLTPNTKGGVRITSTLATNVIEGRFRDVSPGQHFVQLFVSRDSFAQFLPIKDALVELGIEYETRIMDGDEVVLSIGNKKRESMVQ